MWPTPYTRFSWWSILHLNSTSRGFSNSSTFMCFFRKNVLLMRNKSHKSLQTWESFLKVAASLWWKWYVCKNDLDRKTETFLEFTSAFCAETAQRPSPWKESKGGFVQSDRKCGSLLQRSPLKVPPRPQTVAQSAADDVVLMLRRLSERVQKPVSLLCVRIQV